MIDIILCVFTFAILILYIFYLCYLDSFFSKIDLEKIIEVIKEKKDK